VTLIENVETYGIDPAEFAHHVQISLACSTAVTPLPGKGKGQQVMVQGNQINYIATLLTGKS
jgi:translation initiation factor 1 (eIF-1/SUI1)